MDPLKIAAGPNGTPALFTADGKIVRFDPHQVPGKGWAVAKIIGSEKTGKTIEIDGSSNYTLEQAQAAAARATRAAFNAARA